MVAQTVPIFEQRYSSELIGLKGDQCTGKLADSETNSITQQYN